MKKRKIVLTLASVILVLSLLLNGCAVLAGLTAFSEIFEALEEEETNPAPLPSITPDESVSHAEYERLEESILPAVPFSQLEYQRVDTQAICDAVAEIQASVEQGSSASDLIDAFDPVYLDYVFFHTMGDYAYIRYTLDLSDSYYDEEYSWYEEQSPVVEQAFEKCYIAMAESSQRDELEDLYFGEGFFAYYDDNQIFSNDRVVELMQQESALQNEYMALQNEMTIVWNGQECLIDDLVNDDSLTNEEYLEVLALYYDKYGPLAAEIYIELIGVRKAIAEELDYESYAHFAYEFYYYRDYTPEQVAVYTDNIATYLSPYYYSALYSSYSSYMDSESVMSALEDVALCFGGEIAASYDYMMEYELYDISSSPSKMPGSYMTYLSSYGMPYMYVSPTEDINDVLTAVHEFGHFVDGYINCNYTSSIDCAEVFSQGLEYLSLDKMGLSNREEGNLTYSKLADSVIVFLTQGCYAEFEQQLYSLPEEELTLENINTIFLECNAKFGMDMTGYEDILAPGWIDIQHFFIAPFYVISYCVSNDVAMQIYQQELENGDGLNAYYDLLYLAADNTILAMLEEAGMTSPFEDGRMDILANFFDENLY